MVIELESIAILAGVLSPVVGWGILVYRDGHARGKVDAVIEEKLSRIHQDIIDLKQTIGNGGYSGLRGEVEEIKLHCAETTGKLSAQISQLTMEGK